MKFTNIAARCCAFVLAIAPALAQDHWVATWAAAPQQPRVAPQAQQRPGGPPSSFSDQTIRMTIHTSIGGHRIRVQLSNTFATVPLAVGGAHLALRAKESTIVPASDHALTFSGKPSFTIPPGAVMISDPLDLDVAPLGDLAISVYLPGEVTSLTTHGTGLHTTYIGKGDLTAAPAMTEAVTSQSWYFLSGVDVMAPAETAAVVTFGDSITDGARSTPDMDRSWPSFFAQRLAAAKINLAVANEGISGNRVLRDGVGVNALARFDRDVLSIAGVKWVMLMESINDIGQGTRKGAASADAVTGDELIAGLRQLVERAHTHGIKAIGCTLTPYEGAAYYSDDGQVMREAVNRWIRTSGTFDAVVDFDAATRDAANPKHYAADVDSGDHLHPGDAGYKAMADAIDLSIFAPKSVTASSKQ